MSLKDSYMQGILANIFLKYAPTDQDVERLISNNVDMPVQACLINGKMSLQSVLSAWE
jgi:hypothetical protein